jgi:hypothetical protein
MRAISKPRLPIETDPFWENLSTETFRKKSVNYGDTLGVFAHLLRERVAPCMGLVGIHRFPL